MKRFYNFRERNQPPINPTQQPNHVRFNPVILSKQLQQPHQQNHILQKQDSLPSNSMEGYFKWKQMSNQLEDKLNSSVQHLFDDFLNMQQKQFKAFEGIKTRLNKKIEYCKQQVQKVKEQNRQMDILLCDNQIHDCYYKFREAYDNFYKVSAQESEWTLVSTDYDISVNQDTLNRASKQLEEAIIQFRKKQRNKQPPLTLSHKRGKNKSELTILQAVPIQQGSKINQYIQKFNMQVFQDEVSD